MGSDVKRTYRILYLLPSFTFGGAERTSLNLLQGVDKSRFRICLVTSQAMFPYFRHIDIEKFYPIEDLGIGVWFDTFRRFVRDVNKVASLLKETKPDLAFGMMHYPAALLAFAKKFHTPNLKVIASPRGPSLEYLQHFEHKVLRRTYLKRIFRFFCRNSDGLVVASTGMKEECVRHFGASPMRVTVIPNSVDSADIAKKAKEEASLDIPPGFRTVVTAGRLEHEKNIPFLLHAFSEARKHDKLKLVVIGDGTERENLHRLSHALGIGGDVLFAGYQTNPYKFIRASDLFVHTCLFEGFANVIIEAMACGIPVIAADCPYGPRDIITHGIDGFLVPMNDKEALAVMIGTLVRDEALRTRITQKGYERAKDFSMNTMAEGYERFFSMIIEGT